VDHIQDRTHVRVKVGLHNRETFLPGEGTSEFTMDLKNLRSKARVTVKTMGGSGMSWEAWETSIRDHPTVVDVELEELGQFVPEGKQGLWQEAMKARVKATTTPEQAEVKFECPREISNSGDSRAFIIGVFLVTSMNSLVGLLQ